MHAIDDLVEVNLKKPDDFKIIVETLTRIGLAAREDRKLYQLCYLLHKRGRYYICHYLEMRALDGEDAPMQDFDLARRNSIIQLLIDWKLLTVVRPDQIEDPRIPIKALKVLKHSEKKEWELIQKYQIGRGKKTNYIEPFAAE